MSLTLEQKTTIYKMYPQIVTIRGDTTYDANGNEVAYDKSAIDSYVNAHAYIAKRAQEYPSIVDQLDYIYHNGIDAWKTNMIDPVKTKYPKGTV
jgi:hypothetical protein